MGNKGDKIEFCATQTHSREEEEEKRKKVADCFTPRQNESRRSEVHNENSRVCCWLSANSHLASFTSQETTHGAQFLSHFSNR